jgi:hypothetical protein
MLGRMSSHDIVLTLPQLDPNNPASGVIFTNVSPLPVTLMVSISVTRAPEQPMARVVFRGLHIATPNREHRVEFKGPATVLTTVLTIYAPSMQAGVAAEVTLTVETPGTLVQARVVGFAPYDA